MLSNEFLAYHVHKRHHFLKRFIGVKDEEVTSYENIITCVLTVTACLCVFSIMEVTSYFLYLNKVSRSCIIRIYAR